MTIDNIENIAETIFIMDGKSSIRHIQKSSQKNNRLILKHILNHRLDSEDGRHTPAGLKIRSC